MPVLFCVYISRYVKEKVVYFIDLINRYVQLVPGIGVTKENKIPTVQGVHRLGEGWAVNR